MFVLNITQFFPTLNVPMCNIRYIKPEILRWQIKYLSQGCKMGSKSNCVVCEIAFFRNRISNFRNFRNQFYTLIIVSLAVELGHPPSSKVVSGHKRSCFVVSFSNIHHVIEFQLHNNLNMSRTVLISPSIYIRNNSNWIV